jgi:hypothetical protein
MARSVDPVFGGVVKIDKKGQDTWIHTVWLADGGHYQLRLQKATSAELKAIEQGKLVVVSMDTAMGILK